MKYYTLKQEDDALTFVDFWAKRYYDGNEPIYREYIKRPLIPKSVRELFAWKAMRINRKSIKAGEHPFVETVISNLDHFCSYQLNTPEDANNFLTNELKDKGMIWKIFTLHIILCIPTGTRSLTKTSTEQCIICRPSQLRRFLVKIEINN